MSLHVLQNHSNINQVVTFEEFQIHVQITSKN